MTVMLKRTRPEETARRTMKFFVRTLLAAAVFAVAQAASCYGAETIRLAVQKTGTFAWELAVIRAHGLDKQADLAIEVTELASPEAGKIALRAGNADMMVSDWLWVSRERALGAKLTFYPYSSALGAVMVPDASPIRTLADLKGRKLAVAGGPIDKSWLLLQARLKQDGIDLKSDATIVYGAPPLLAAKTLDGEMDASINYWNFCAALEAKGFRRVAGIEDILPKLGAKGRIAMVGYVFDEGWGNANRDAVARFIAMTRKAKEILSTSDAEWDNDRAADRRRRCRDPARLSRSLSRRNSAPPDRRRGSRRARSLSRAGRDRRPRTGRASAGARARHLLSRDRRRLRCCAFCHSSCSWRPGGSLRCSPAPAKLPPPPAVLAAVMTEARSGALFFNLGVTLARVALAFILAMTLGSAIGYLMGRVRLANRLGDPWLILLLNLPALVVIVLAYIWAGLTEVAAIAAIAINKLPTAVVTLREGTRALDAALDEMATVFAIPRWRAFRHVILPQLAPYIAAAARSGLSLVWKIVLVAELLGRPNGVGFEIGVAFQLFDIPLLLAYSLSFAAVVLVIETALVQPFEARLSRWRPRAA